MKSEIEDEVIGEQGLAALAFGKFAEEYNICGEVKREQGLAALAFGKFEEVYNI